MYRILLTMTFFSICHQAEGQLTPDVRKVSWGMSEEEVRYTEKLELLPIDVPEVARTEMYDSNEKVSVLMYQTTVVGINVILLYVFVEDRLGMMSYASSEDYSDYNLYASDFGELNNTLTEKYGRSKSDVDNVPDMVRKAGMASDIGLLLRRGGYRKTIEWQTLRTVISHKISNEGYGVAHVLMYESLEFNNRRKKSIQDDI